MHPLDNVIWTALTTRQAEFAETSTQARRFVPEVAPLAGFSEPTREGYESWKGWLGGRETIALFLDEPYEPRAGWELVGKAPLLQMVCENGNALPITPIPSAELIELSGTNSAEMIELTALTKPGPFNKRTHELVTYLGVPSGGRLVAIACGRLKNPGAPETNPVRTHPAHPAPASPRP